LRTYSPPASNILAMTPKQRRRLAFASALVVAGAGAAALIIYALQDNVLYFYSPSDVSEKHIASGVAFRVGGLVEKNSVKHGEGATIHFVITDGRTQVPVDFTGVLPALFREGQGVVAMGALEPTGTFAASEILAKHDERYMPPEVVSALKRSGRWKEGQ
jgi:cytochrome c-type biogenesis protein CcmE